MITNAIRNANTEYEVLLLLIDYVETARSQERLHFLSVRAAELPLQDAAAVRVLLKGLLFELDAASRNLDDYTRDILHEALHIFGAALEKMHAIRCRQQARLAA